MTFTELHNYRVQIHHGLHLSTENAHLTVVIKGRDPKAKQR